MTGMWWRPCRSTQAEAAAGALVLEDELADEADVFEDVLESLLGFAASDFDVSDFAASGFGSEEVVGFPDPPLPERESLR
ncbi:hypothetical protein [Krasilnikovia cinnamomea]|uniref:hypothetical protein n=1 Tax=Krasilnikovia cinnamomea TaxID=349313 RepID=UPI001F5ECD6C|nr:hypothetical protein [Krasilnikovia cinnamomea]